MNARRTWGLENGVLQASARQGARWQGQQHDADASRGAQVSNHDLPVSMAGSSKMQRNQELEKKALALDWECSVEQLVVYCRF